MDHRTRRNREDNRNKDFAAQMGAFTDTYMAWDMHRANGGTPPPEQDSSGGYPIHIVDVFGEYATHGLSGLFF